MYSYVHVHVHGGGALAGRIMLCLLVSSCMVMGACAYKVSKLQMLSFASRTYDARTRELY